MVGRAMRGVWDRVLFVVVVVLQELCEKGNWANDQRARTGLATKHGYL